ncbi:MULTISPECIES: LexA family protein [unclassified Ensifer]|uniref:LexA family protein n=1 Tax=unclassified Ensifer TaxID=2633371 RepID=UPI0007145FBA|nr:MULTISPECIES: S24 family peptidase [unclassified Ensifer]KQX55479.1 hypothetical protein ASD49_25340 [Ensifer sp. Root1298]KQX90972.1 hypothetical protein ASD41_24030 [Ensifer sp. Root1312]KRC25816.1 hypothetical protein ASE29_22490 [Ensifer sp. Root74]KRD73698.1 hypothetical protein ASE71_19825 [Ensifer sp. Root954]
MDVIFPEMPNRHMETSLQKRLKFRMDFLGLNAYQTAKKAGLGDSFVRDILRGRTRSPSAENLAKLAAALETTPDYFTLEVEPAEAPKPLPLPITGLTVVGDIQAGTWLDRTLFDDGHEHEIIPVARDPRFPHSKQYALRVRGDSMDREFPDGSFVTCVDYYDSGIGMKDGLIVHVERHSGPLVEVTLKAIEHVDGELMLSPRSTNPKHLPLKVEGDGGTEIVIKGVVIGSYRRTAL